MEERAPQPGFVDSLVLPFGLLFATLVAIATLFEQNLLCFIAVACVLYVAVAMPYSRFKMALAGFALPFGTFGEYMCCRYDLWIYAKPTFWGLPLWLPLIWPILMVTFWQMARYFDSRLSNAKPATATAVTWVLKVAILGYAVTTFFIINPVIAGIFISFLVLMLFFARQRFNWIFFTVAALCGSLGEISCIQFDVWYYTSPMFASVGFPLSLPLAWGLSANIIWMLARLVAPDEHQAALPAKPAPV